MKCPDCEYAKKEREGMILDSFGKTMSEADAIRRASTERCHGHTVTTNDPQSDFFDLIEKTKQLTKGLK